MILAGMGLVGFVLSYEMAEKMTGATRHRVRLAMLLLAAGCLGMVARLEWPQVTDWALLLLAAGWVAFLLVDRRQGVPHVAGTARALGAAAARPSRPGASPPDAGASAGDDLAGVVDLAHRRAGDVMGERRRAVS